MQIETLREFFGWCLVLNGGLFILTAVNLLLLKGWASRLHAKMFGVEEGAVSRIYFQVLAFYKIVLIVFNLVPYVALRLMG